MKTGKMGCQLTRFGGRPGQGTFQAKHKQRGRGKEKDQAYEAQLPREGTAGGAEIAGDGF